MVYAYVMADRVCSKCGSDGPFYVGHSPYWCKACLRQAARDNFAKKPEYQREWRIANPHARRVHTLKKYGITPREYDELAANQGGVCAICGEVGERALCVDHDHVSGAVRGLLCSHCNYALGHFRDDPQRLHGALAYLAAPPAQGHLVLGLAS